MNKQFLFFCTPDVFRPTAMKSLTFLKQTNLKDTELIIADNCYDDNFRHPCIMQDLLTLTDGKPAVFIDDDVFITNSEWLSRLQNTAESADADITGCIHTYETGEINHFGALVYSDGSTELIREPFLNSEETPYVPAVSSALVYLRNPKNIRFDPSFEKYQHDLDICLQAWSEGRRVAIARNLKVVHQMAGYMSTRSGFLEAYIRDSKIFAEKWQPFAFDKLYRIKELKIYRIAASQQNWEKLYNEASRMAHIQPETAAASFQRIAEQCPFQWRKSGAHYHLYKLKHKQEDLEECLKLNPNHMKAREELSHIRLHRGGQ